MTDQTLRGLKIGRPAYRTLADKPCLVYRGHCQVCDAEHLVPARTLRNEGGALCCDGSRRLAGHLHGKIMGGFFVGRLLAHASKGTNRVYECVCLNCRAVVERRADQLRKGVPHICQTKSYASTQKKSGGN